MVATVLIAAALAGYSIFVVVRKVQRRKNGCGGCCGCGEGNRQKSKKILVGIALEGGIWDN